MWNPMNFWFWLVLNGNNYNKLQLRYLLNYLNEEIWYLFLQEQVWCSVHDHLDFCCNTNENECGIFFSCVNFFVLFSSSPWVIYI